MKVPELDQAVEAWRKAKRTERARMADLDLAIKAASARGMSERAIMTATGLNRNTVRRALGKSRSTTVSETSR